MSHKYQSSVSYGGTYLVRPWSWVSFANLQEARFPILQESAYTTDSDTELSRSMFASGPECVKTLRQN
jgi:hypothetical protein